jgi:phage tail protein X
MTEQMYYITSDNDRWDHLAFDFYGDASLVEPLLQANPAWARQPVLDAGIKIIIPPKPIANEQISTVKAPWK